MMQQVASTKADVAAFAALQGPTEQPESNLAFDQVLQQQQNPAPVAKPATSNSNTLKDQRTQSVKESKATRADQKQIINTDTGTRKTAQRTEQSTLDTSIKTDKKSEPLAKSNQATEHEDKPAKSSDSKDPAVSDDVTSLDDTLDDKSDEQKLVQSNEQWLDLVWSLQEQAVDDEQTDATEITNSMPIDNQDEIDSIQALQVWLESKDDKLQALTQLLEAKPELKIMLAKTDLSQNETLHSLLSQALFLGKDAALQTESKPVAATDTTAVMSDDIKQQLLKVSEDIATLLKNNRLSPAEITQLNQALSQSLSQNTSLPKELKDLLQTKLESSPSLAAGAGKKTKEILGDMPIIFVPQKDDAGNILEANAANSANATKITLPEEASKETLQALLDKINGTNKPATEPAADIQIKSDSQDVNEALVAQPSAGQSNVDKISLSKDAPTVNNPAVLNTSTAEISTKDNSELKALLALSDDDLDAALDELAQRVATLLRDDKQNQAGAANKTMSDAGTLAAASSKDILAALKAGVAEFKQQLAAGHEPGLDLKALVAQAVEKTTDGAVVAKVAEGLDKSVRTLGQSLTAINQLNDSASINQALNTAALDSQVTQAEQHKAAQLNQFDNKLDKALNLQKPESHQQLADKVRWMVNTNNLVAEIRLDPAELGSVHVKVSLSAESATVNFVVQSHHARDALEAATPKLREMLAEKGIELGQSTVKQDSQAKQDAQGQTGQQAKNGSGSLLGSETFNEDETLLMGNNLQKNSSSSAIDYFV